MGIKNAVLREHEKILLDILANNLFNAGRTVNLNEDNLDAVWCEAYAQAVTLMAFHNSNEDILKSDRCEYIRKKLGKTLATNAKIDFEHIRICDIMKNAGIPCSILKGFASALYYPDPLMRSMGDVDFLIDTDDFEKASDALKNNGYESAEKGREIIL